MGDGGVGDEDEGAEADAEGDDGAVLGAELAEDGLQLEKGLGEP